MIVADGKAQDESQWIMSQRILSAIAIPGFLYIFGFQVLHHRTVHVHLSVNRCSVVFRPHHSCNLIVKNTSGHVQQAAP